MTSIFNPNLSMHHDLPTGRKYELRGCITPTEVSDALYRFVKDKDKSAVSISAPSDNTKTIGLDNLEVAREAINHYPGFILIDGVTRVKM